MMDISEQERLSEVEALEKESPMCYPIGKGSISTVGG